MIEKMVEVEIEIEDEIFLSIAKEAHKRDITFNKMVCIILKEEMEKEKKEENKNV